MVDVLHGKRPGTTGYRKGCRCAECIEANATYLREWREKRRLEEMPVAASVTPVVPVVGPPVAPADLGTAGPIEEALRHDLDDEADGDPTYLRAIALTVARSLDGAVTAMRHDLVSPLAQRLVDIGARLFPPAPEGDGNVSEDEKRGELLRLMRGEGETEGEAYAS